MTAFYGLISVFSSSLGPLKSAILNGILSACEALYAIASAQYSNPWTLAFAISTTAASITLSIVGAAQTEANMQDAQRSTQEAHTILNTAASIGGTWL